MEPRIKLLPLWCIPNTKPAFYDVESDTAVEMTGKVYAAMRELQTDYNKFVTEVNKAITDLITGVNTDQEKFEEEINKIVHDYIKMIDTKIAHQDRAIEEAIQYMKENLKTSITELITQMHETGEFDESVLNAINNIGERVLSLETSNAELTRFREDSEERLTNVELLSNSNKRMLANIYKNNVEDMKQTEDLIEGDIVQTLGYYEANDGGGATYLIREKQDSDVEDLGSIHFINSELVAELIVENNTVNIKQFGARGDGETDDTEKINNAINYIFNNNGGNIFIPTGKYMIDANVGVNLKDNVNLIFNGGILKAITNDLERYSIVNIIHSHNNRLENPCIIGDRDSHMGTTGEFGYGINILGNSYDITIHNAKISDCWGDGIFIYRQRVTNEDKSYIDYIPHNIRLTGVTHISNCRRQGISVIAGERIYIKHLICKDINGTLPMSAIDIESEHSVDHVGNIRIDYIQAINCNKAFTMRTRSLITGNISIGTIEYVNPYKLELGGLLTPSPAFRVFFEYFSTEQSKYTVSVDRVIAEEGHGIEIENIYKGVTPTVVIGDVFSKEIGVNNIADPSDKSIFKIKWTLDTELSNILGGLIINNLIFEKFKKLENDDKGVSVRPIVFNYTGNKTITDLIVQDITINKIQVNKFDNLINLMQTVSYLLVDKTVNINTNLEKINVYKQDTNMNLIMYNNDETYFLYKNSAETSRLLQLRPPSLLRKYKLIVSGITQMKLSTSYFQTLFTKIILDGVELGITDGVCDLGTFTEKTTFLFDAIGDTINITSIK